ncbi:MAG: nuclear transport factor 2 family protein [Novosphingobium sp.]
MPKTLDELAAESEIKDVHLRFCRANDRRDEELFRGCFHADAVVEMGDASLTVDEIVAVSKQMLDRYAVTWHAVSNQLVEVKGDTAWAEHYTISSHRFAASETAPLRDWVAHGRYIDRMERRDGEWRIARRRFLVDYTRTDLVAAGDPEMPGGAARDRSDLSYAMRV